MTEKEALFTALDQAERDVSKGKGETRDVLLFGQNREDNLHDLSAMLRRGEVPKVKYNSFYVYIPKTRKVIYIDYPNKIIQRAAYNCINPRLNKGFNSETYTDAWCAAFVAAMAMMCDLQDVIPIEVSCPQMIVMFQRLGEWIENDAYTPSPGDLVFYDWDDNGVGDNTGAADHVGIVRSVSGSTFTVIEGNMSDAVRIALPGA